MDFLKGDLVGIAQALLSGFVAAWVFYNLTAHPKQTPFERIVQALILTAFVRAGVVPIKGYWNRVWTPDAEFLLSIGTAVALGVVFAWLANHDLPHALLRWLGITKRTSFPSQWFRVFNQNRKIQYVVLTLKGDKLRRVYGWVREWPDQPDSGHFAVHDAEWLLEDNQRCPLHGVECIMIAARDIETCEFMLPANQIRASKEELDRCEKLMVDLHKGAKNDEATAAGEGTERARIVG
jgi:Family of unknown function (DUF6338)